MKPHPFSRGDEPDDGHGTTIACPECDSPCIRKWRRDDLYECDDCGEKFRSDEARERDRRHTPESGRRCSPGTRALLDADPDDIP